ncbi:hypothetical protein CRG98_037442 [Punica granatum]|uniref:Uncharacterized protein n=1 Tax=Punica granatum TaxID=22663 RepID=A0A2I0IFM7_PUNGR|nr:hypothetical protein CRG98_037442 [Punica granatum]
MCQTFVHFEFKIELKNELWTGLIKHQIEVNEGFQLSGAKFYDGLGNVGGSPPATDLLDNLAGDPTGLRGQPGGELPRPNRLEERGDGCRNKYLAPNSEV